MDRKCLGPAPAQAQEFCVVVYPFPYTDVSGVGGAFCPGIMEAYVTGVSKGRLAKSPDEHLAHCILGADVPSDQSVTGTMITLKASGESWNCGFSIGGAPGRSAPHVEPCARGK